MIQRRITPQFIGIQNPRRFRNFACRTNHPPSKSPQHIQSLGRYFVQKQWGCFLVKHKIPVVWGGGRFNTLKKKAPLLGKKKTTRLEFRRATSNLGKLSYNSQTLPSPETNIALENGWLEDDPFLLGQKAYFQGRFG